jgi:hypothetical protein
MPAFLSQADAAGKAKATVARTASRKAKRRRTSQS